MSLQNWLEFYEEAERIKRTTVVQAPVEELPLRGLLEVKRAPIPEEKKTELAVDGFIAVKDVLSGKRTARLAEVSR